MRLVLEVTDTEAMREDESFIRWVVKMSTPGFEHILRTVDPDGHNYRVEVLDELED